MCGIAGLFSLEGRARVDRPLLDRMTDSLAHRGPDGRGTWFSPGVGLGHRRLAIVDPEGGAQPWVEEGLGAALTYNGELYNQKELRRELEAAGVAFRSNCDTEVLFHALLYWGVEQALDRFRGMFAFALYEKGPHRLTLARDPLGVKPLYWAMRGGLVRFGSEIKTILADPSFPRSPDPVVLDNYLAHYRLSFRGRTLFRHVQELAPGSFVTWEGRRRQERRYWRLPRIPEAEKRDPGEEKVVQEFRQRMATAVQRRRMSDVPLGAYLSGGIDSAVLVTLLRSMTGSGLETFAIGFEEEGGNEFPFSRAVAARLGVAHNEITLTEDGYFRNLEPLIRIKDTPLSVPNEVPLRFLSSHLKKRITVVLSGEGADELLGGYQALVRSPHDYLTALAIREGSYRGTDAQRDRVVKSLEALYGASDFPGGQREQFLRLYQWIPREQRTGLLSKALRVERAEREIADFWEEVWAELEGAGLDPYEKVLHVLEEIHLSALLLRLDATTMAEGVEGRVPYTDRDLVEWVNGLPVGYKVRWRDGEAEQEALGQSALEAAGRLDHSKLLLRISFQGDIPDEVLTRPKAAFPVPLDEWLYGRRHDWARERILTEKMTDLFQRSALETLLDTARGRQEGMKIWMLANVGIWLESYFG